MTLLAQQELLEPSPTRRLIVPAGCEAWFGVDPSTHHVSIAWVLANGCRDVRTAAFERLDGAARLSGIYAETRRLVREILVELGNEIRAPGLVLVEQPSGSAQQVNLPLIYAVGIIQAAIFDEVRHTAGHAPHMETCTSSWWKKRSTGRGNVYKPKRGDDKPYGVLVWARENGYGCWSFDEADAWGMAEAARRDVALDVR